MEQASKKKLKEERSGRKAGCGRAAANWLRVISEQRQLFPYLLPPQPNLNRARVAAEKDRARAVYPIIQRQKNEAAYFETEKRAALPVVKMSLPVVASTFTSPSTLPCNYPRPLRKGEETTSLWIAPYVDADDVYHQPATVLCRDTIGVGTTSP
ncbi:TraV family lipoprotein [Klebsiella pneumoniae]|nr:TraV family lipoprotein [Klebsiella pneumoniae]